MFLRKIRQKVYTLRLDSIVKRDSSLSLLLDYRSPKQLESIVKCDFSLAGEDFKDEGCRMLRRFSGANCKSQCYNKDKFKKDTR